MLVKCSSSTKMYGLSWRLAPVLALLVAAEAARPHRRSMPTPQSLPVSKGGWRPVMSNGVMFGYNTAPLHAPSYKIQVPVYDHYASSSRPIAARDGGKLTSIAQSYRPTTLRSAPAPGPPVPAASQPINTYLNPFALNNNGVSYKYVQNYPVDSVLIRNPHNPYAARPVFTKYHNKKQQYPNFQLNNVQPIQFGQYATSNPGEPKLDSYGKPTEMRNPQIGTEIFKPEVYKLPDSDPAPQTPSQQVKTAQQQQTQKIQYPQFAYQDPLYSPGVLGSFGGFNIQPVKFRDQGLQQVAKTTYLPPQPTKTTLFNSYSFAPFKTTPTQFFSTTPKLQTTANQLTFGSWNDFKNLPTQAPKPNTNIKIDPNSNKGHNFKASPQDPFIKHFNINDYKVSTYNPTVQTTTFAYTNYHGLPSQSNAPVQSSAVYFDQNNNFDYEKKKSKIHDSVAAGINHQTSQQYAVPPSHAEDPPKTAQKVTYEVTESFDTGDLVTHASPPNWAPSDGYNPKSTEQSVTPQQYEAQSKPATSPLPEELAIVTESDKGYENSLGYDNQLESQSRRPLGDDFEPIGKHKLKDYYYRVSTPAYNDHARRTKRPESRPIDESFDNVQENKDLMVEPLPTLAPNRHFKRPSSPAPEPLDKDKIKKRNKIRRRRPNGGHRDGNTRHKSTTETPIDNESHTIKPRSRSTSKPSTTVTAPTITTDLTTSALPTISPTIPTIVRKKLINRRPLITTTTEKYETTTTAYKDYDTNKDSQIMKISGTARPHQQRISTASYEHRTEIPDYTHKQDEKDTPTSDIAVDTQKTSIRTETTKSFSFHRDSKPIDSKVETVTIREVINDNVGDETNDITTTPRAEGNSNTTKILRPRMKTKYDRPRFSVKDYRNRLSSTTSTTEKPVENHAPRLRFPQRRLPNNDSNETTTERKKFTPKEPRTKSNASETNDQTEKEVHSTRQPYKQRHTTVEPTESTTQRLSSRVRQASRRQKPEETTETANQPLPNSRRPLRKKIKDTDAGESVQDVSVTEPNEKDMTSERTRSESAIMKIADKKHHQEHIEHLFEHSKRVSDLTLAASKDYNTPGMFKTVASSSRRIPSYFTIATDDPILPIEAFFPQLNQKKES